MNRGKLIVIEGTDGSGKNTQSKNLTSRLQSEGYDSEMISFPRYGSPTGDIVGDCYLGKGNRIQAGSWFPDETKSDSMVPSMFYAADRLAAKEEMEAKLNSGINIICDRYVESNMGHQAGKRLTEEGREDIANWIYNLEYEFLKLPRPDSVIFLYMPKEVAMALKRDQTDNLDLHEADSRHLEMAEETYIQLANSRDWHRINCSEDYKTPRPIEDIGEEVYQHVTRLMRD